MIGNSELSFVRGRRSGRALRARRVAACFALVFAFGSGTAWSQTVFTEIASDPGSRDRLSADTFGIVRPI